MQRFTATFALLATLGPTGIMVASAASPSEKGVMGVKPLGGCPEAR